MKRKFYKGDKVIMTKLAREQFPIRAGRSDIGTVIADPQNQKYITVHKEGTKTPIRYASVFWRHLS